MDSFTQGNAVEGKLKILLVDDDIACLESYASVLRPFGHECMIESDPRKAVDRMQSAAFDLVITDYRMPEMNGIDIAEFTRKLCPDAVIIVITAYEDLEIAAAALNLRVAGIYSKPVSFSILTNAVTMAKKNRSRRNILEKEMKDSAAHDEERKSQSRLNQASESDNDT